MQEFYVLKCFSCNVHQVHIVKKSSKKWACKMCGEKQSIIKVFCQGTAKDCREHVQKLNLLRGQQDQESVPYYAGDENYLPSKSDEQDDQFYDDEDLQGKEDDQQFSKVDESQASNKPTTSNNAPVSKWACFLDPEDNE